MGLPGAAAMEALAGGEGECPSQRGLFMLPWWHACLLAPLGHPRGTALGAQMASECIRKDHHLMRVQALGMHAHPGQPFAPLWGIIFRMFTS
jgi:hypothetical protein